MPELPEVETTRRHLSDAIAGRRFVEVSVTHIRTARHNASPEEVVERLTDRTIRSVDRHGKFLVVTLDDGYTMVAHLGMSGRFGIHHTTDNDELEPHTHFAAQFEDGTEVRFVDPRTFGFVAVFDEDEIEGSGVARLGPDAWISPPSAEELSRRLEGRVAPIKALLLDQDLIAGLGNIYVDESLFMARIHPERPGGEIDLPETEALLESIEAVLGEALSHGGTTLADMAYLLPDGNAGENLAWLSVYGREGEACRNCGTPIERIVIRGRSTHFCPVDQPK